MQSTKVKETLMSVSTIGKYVAYTHYLGSTRVQSLYEAASKIVIQLKCALDFVS